MSKNYDLIATVDIDIASPLVDETSFDNLLIVGPLPKVAPEKGSSQGRARIRPWTKSSKPAGPPAVTMPTPSEWPHR